MQAVGFLDIILIHNINNIIAIIEYYQYYKKLLLECY